MDFQTVDDLTDLEGVAVEDAHDVEAAGAEFTVVQDGFAQVADATSAMRHSRSTPREEVMAAIREVM